MSRATVCSNQWRVLGFVPVDAANLLLASGEHRLLLDTALEAEEGGHLKVELRIWGEAEWVPRH